MGRCIPNLDPVGVDHCVISLRWSPGLSDVIETGYQSAAAALDGAEHLGHLSGNWHVRAVDRTGDGEEWLFCLFPFNCVLIGVKTVRRAVEGGRAEGGPVWEWNKPYLEMVE